MIKYILKTLLMPMLITSAYATQPTGTISSISFYGSGVNEVIFVIIEPKSSACPYSGAYVISSKDRPGITSALLASFHAQNTVTLFGTGQCGTPWSNHEVISYATFKR